MRKYERDLRQDIERLGIPADGLKLDNSGHYSLWIRAGGRERRFTFPATPSDWRGLKNKMSQIRTWVRTQEMNS